MWIPVDNIADYKRIAYASQLDTEETDEVTNSKKIQWDSSEEKYFVEALPEDEKKSVEENKGFYIGRYEAGDKESTTEKTPRENGTSTENTVTIKAVQVPYNNISKSDAQSLAEKFYKDQGYKAKTKLVSSYAWDTAIAFMANNSDYGNNSKEGNYLVTSFEYEDLDEETKNKDSYASTLVPTGQTTSVCNIYDMGGNLWEWTTESYNNGQLCTRRGGAYNNGPTDSPAGARTGYPDEYVISYHDIGFRIALFM